MNDTNPTFPAPFRLTFGGHEPGSGNASAMQIISCERGDTEITDYPACSAEPLAELVHRINGRLVAADFLLTPQDSVTVLDIAHLTVDTTPYTEAQLLAWLSDLLVDPTYGAVRHTAGDAEVAVRRVADLLVRRETVTSDEWLAAQAANTDAVLTAGFPDYDAVPNQVCDLASACAYLATDDKTTDKYVSDDFISACLSDLVPTAAAVAYVRWAVQRFRDILGLDAPVIDPDVTRAAVAQMTATPGGAA